MSGTWVAILSVYAAGFVAWLFRLGLMWEDINWDSVGPLPVLGVAFWPMALPVAIGRHVKARAKERAKRRKLAEAEQRKWLEAQIP